MCLRKGLNIHLWDMKGASWASVQTQMAWVDRAKQHESFDPLSVFLYVLALFSPIYFYFVHMAEIMATLSSKFPIRIHSRGYTLLSSFLKIASNGKGYPVSLLYFGQKNKSVLIFQVYVFLIYFTGCFRYCNIDL